MRMGDFGREYSPKPFLCKQNPRSMPLSAVIITFNEEHNLGRCLESLTGLADEIIVVDSYSTDRTVDIALQYGARVLQHPFGGHIQQKNYALDQASFDHVLSLDADEALDDGLRKAVAGFGGQFGHDAYWCRRLTNYCGHWVRFCGWYPDMKMRLFDRRKGRWGGINPHDKFQLDDPSAKTPVLPGNILHYSFYTVDDHIRQVRYFTDIASQALYSKGVRPGWRHVWVHPAWTFLRMFLFRLGLLDGWRGLQICAISAWATHQKYRKLRGQWTSARNVKP
jgi:glycosyltransferase involved in cell wall biosynthesis